MGAAAFGHAELSQGLGCGHADLLILAGERLGEELREDDVIGGLERADALGAHRSLVIEQALLVERLDAIGLCRANRARICAALQRVAALSDFNARNGRMQDVLRIDALRLLDDHRGAGVVAGIFAQPRVDLLVRIGGLER